MCWESLPQDSRIIIGITIIVLEVFYISLVFISMKIMCRVGYLIKIHIPAVYNQRWAKIVRFIVCIMSFQIIRCVLNILMQFETRYSDFSRLGIYIVDVFQILAVQLVIFESVEKEENDDEARYTVRD